MNEFETLTHIIPKVGSVSRIFSNIVAGRGISKEDVKILVEFRDTLPNVTTLEHEVVSAVLSLSHKKVSFMLNSLSLGLKNVISETDSIEFFRSINLYPNSHPIQINNGEKVRVCYLISHLADTLESPQREKWLYNLGIKISVYRSKYRQPISDMPSESNKAFSGSLREIFGK